MYFLNYLHSSMDRFEEAYAKRAEVWQENLHSSMDRFEEKDFLCQRFLFVHLHSSMDRFEVFSKSCSPKYGASFTFQYG